MKKFVSIIIFIATLYSICHEETGWYIISSTFQSFSIIDTDNILVDGLPPEPNDAIGIFTSDGGCTGWATLDDTHNNGMLTIAATGDDGSDYTEGFGWHGDSLSFRFFDASSSDETTIYSGNGILPMEFNGIWSDGGPVFLNNGMNVFTGSISINNIYGCTDDAACNYTSDHWLEMEQIGVCSEQQHISNETGGYITSDDGSCVQEESEDNDICFDEQDLTVIQNIITINEIDFNGEIEDFGVQEWINTRLVDFQTTTYNISNLPESIGELSQLNQLRLQNNSLASIPSSIGNLSLLNKLQLQLNVIEDLPETIGFLNNLDTLDLRFNNLSSLPESICDLNLDFSNSETFLVDFNYICPPYPSCISVDDLGFQYTSNCEENTNIPPIANAGIDQFITIPHDGSIDTDVVTITLLGEQSIDPDNDDISFFWEKIIGPDDIALSNNQSTNPTFNSFNPFGSSPKEYQFQLTVTDSYGASDIDSTNITIYSEENEPPIILFDPPIAIFVMNPDDNPSGTQIVVLDAYNASYDPDGDSFISEWFDMDGNIVPSLQYLSYGEISFILRSTDFYGEFSEAIFSVIITENYLLLGDLNMDNSINIFDVIIGINIILGINGATSLELYLLDFNEDESTDILDIVGMVNYILGNSINH